MEDLIRRLENLGMSELLNRLDDADLISAHVDTDEVLIFDPSDYTTEELFNIVMRGGI